MSDTSSESLSRLSTASGSSRWSSEEDFAREQRDLRCEPVGWHVDLRLTQRHFEDPWQGLSHLLEEDWQA